MTPSFHRLLKALLWIFNLVYGLFGFISLVCGASAVALLHTNAMNVIHQWVGTYGVFGNKSLVASAGLLTSVGVFILITSILGCVVLLRYNRCAIITYVCLISFIMILQFAAAISALTLSNQVSDNVSIKLTALQTAIKGESVDWEKDPAAAMFKNIQDTWGCCGVNGYKEWLSNVTWFQKKYNNYQANHTDRHVAFSGCCVTGEFTKPCSESGETPDCCSTPIDDWNMNPPCKTIISSHLLHSLSIVAGASLTFAFLEIFGLVVSCLFIRSSDINNSGMERLHN